MIDIRDYINLSKTAGSINDTYTKPEELLKNYESVYENEKKSFLRYYFINNCPFLFRTYPLLFEQITQYLADKIKISPLEVKLIGSAKTGFSLSAPPHYGKPFSKDSDLDFSIINEDIFFSLQDEFNSWADQYIKKNISPKNEKAKIYWDNNLSEVPNYQLKNGLIDTYKIPNWYEFPVAQNINNSLSLIKINLKEKYSIEVKGASARVYISWSTFIRQINLNTKFLMKKIEEKKVHK